MQEKALRKLKSRSHGKTARRCEAAHCQLLQGQQGVAAPGQTQRSICQSAAAAAAGQAPGGRASGACFRPSVTAYSGEHNPQWRPPPLLAAGG